MWCQPYWKLAMPSIRPGVVVSCTAKRVWVVTDEEFARAIARPEGLGSLSDEAGWTLDRAHVQPRGDTPRDQQIQTLIARYEDLTEEIDEVRAGMARLWTTDSQPTADP